MSKKVLVSYLDMVSKEGSKELKMRLFWLKRLEEDLKIIIGMNEGDLKLIRVEDRLSEEEIEVLEMDLGRKKEVLDSVMREKGEMNVWVEEGKWFRKKSRKGGKLGG